MLLKIDDITVAYDKHKVLENFSLDIDEGEIVCLVGESGSGKTTVIRSVLGLLPTSGHIISGDIIYNGQSLLSMNQKEFMSVQGTQMSMIFQDSGSMLNPVRKIGSQFI